MTVDVLDAGAAELEVWLEVVPARVELVRVVDALTGVDVLPVDALTVDVLTVEVDALTVDVLRAEVDVLTVEVLTVEVLTVEVLMVDVLTEDDLLVDTSLLDVQPQAKVEDGARVVVMVVTPFKGAAVSELVGNTQPHL